MLRRALLLPLALLAPTACSSREHVVQDAFRWQAPLVPGTTLHLRNLNGTVVVRESPDGMARVSAAKRWRKGRERDVRIVMRPDARGVVVCALWGENGRCSASHYDAAGRRSAWTRFVRLFSLRQPGRTDMSVRFEVALPRGVAVDARTVNGRVEVEGARAGVAAETVNGAVRARAVGGPLKLASVNGSVHADVASLGAWDPVQLTSVNGSVEAILPPTLDGTVRLSTVHGHVSTDFPLTLQGGTPGDKRSIEATLGHGGRAITLTTVNGSVRLRRQGVEGAPEVTPTGAPMSWKH